MSIKKARTAALFGVDSIDLGEHAQTAAIYSLEHTNGGLISFGGGVVLHDTNGDILAPSVSLAPRLNRISLSPGRCR